MSILETVPTNLLCVIFAVFIALIALAGLYVCEKYITNNIPPDSNEIGGIVFGTISLIYSLVLAFVIVASWDDYKDLNSTIARETEKLHSVIAHSSMLPDSIQFPVKALLIAYCNQVLEKEWKMQRINGDNQVDVIPALRVMLLQLESQNRLGQNLHKVLDEDLSSISDLRRNRLSYSKSHVPDFVWFILKGGSIMLIVFYYFLHVASAVRKRFYLVILSGYIAMCMFMVYSLDTPSIGKSSVHTGQYIEVLASLKHCNFLTTNLIEK